MGTTHKLKPEVIEFIRKTREEKPTLGCRKIASLVYEKFKVDLSKSSINTIIKNSGLNLPVGRRRKKPRASSGGIPAIKEVIKTAAESVIELSSPKEELLLAPVEEPPTPPVIASPEGAKQSQEIASSPQEETVAPRNDEEESAKEEKPKEEAPVEPMPVAEAPSVDKPTEEPSKEEPKEEKAEAPVEEPPKEEAPKEEVVEPAPAEPVAPEPPKEEPPKEEVPPPVIASLERAKQSQEIASSPQEEAVAPRNDEKNAPQPEAPLEVTAQAAPLTEAVISGVLLLKAVDSLTGGILSISNLIKERFKLDLDYIARDEFLLYAPLFGISLDNFSEPFKEESGIWPLINQHFKNEEIDLYVSQLHDAISLNPQIAKVITQGFQEVCAVKVQISNSDVFYLGPQMHTVYSDGQQIPYDFSLPVFCVREKLKEQIKDPGALCLLTAPGFDNAPKELFDFILSLGDKDNGVSSFSLCGDKLRDLEKIPLEQKRQFKFLFAIWPWQFQRTRKIKLLGKFQSVSLRFPEKQIYAAETEVSLTQSVTGQSVTLRGCAVKFSPREKIALIIVSNFTKEQKKLQDLAESYFSSWPDPLISFESFSSKTELFTYSSESHRLFKFEHLSATTEIKDLFKHYLKGLDSYLRWHIMPAGYEDKEFLWAKSNLYALKAVLTPKGDYLQVAFEIPADYPFLKDLQYTCQRLNESNITFFSDKKVLFLVK